MRKIFSLMLIFIGVNMFAQEQVGPKFPAADEGWIKHEIALPAYENESEYKLELRFFENKEVDCNNHTLFGNLDEQVLDGWGYNFYVLKPKMFENTNAMISTMMFCEQAPTMKKVYFNIAQVMDYNSKVPLVVYTPSNVELEYSTWHKIKSEISK